MENPAGVSTRWMFFDPDKPPKHYFRQSKKTLTVTALHGLYIFRHVPCSSIRGIFRPGEYLKLFVTSLWLFPICFCGPAAHIVLLGGDQCHLGMLMPWRVCLICEGVGQMVSDYKRLHECQDTRFPSRTFPSSETVSAIHSSCQWSCCGLSVYCQRHV